jgi:hypothetical protein
MQPPKVVMRSVHQYSVEGGEIDSLRDEGQTFSTTMRHAWLDQQGLSNGSDSK